MCWLYSAKSVVMLVLYLLQWNITNAKTPAVQIFSIPFREMVEPIRLMIALTNTSYEMKIVQEKDKRDIISILIKYFI